MMNKFSVGQTVWAFFAPGGLSRDWAVSPGDIHLRQYEYLGECGIRCLEFGYIIKAEDCELFASESVARAAMISHWGRGTGKFKVGQTVWAFHLQEGNVPKWTLGAKEIKATRFMIENIVPEAGRNEVYHIWNVDTGSRHLSTESDLFLTKEELLNSLRGL